MSLANKNNLPVQLWHNAKAPAVERWSFISDVKNMYVLDSVKHNK